MPRILVIEHHAADTPGALAPALGRAGFSLDLVRRHAGEALPASVADHAGLVLLGGPMGAADPALAPEYRLLEQALAAGMPVLGICLGSQMLATALGGTVARAPRSEVGWHAIDLTPPATCDALFQVFPPRFTTFHWHGDAFTLPPGAVALASSALTPCQAFRHGPRTYGLQFHLEADRPVLEAMASAYGDELDDAGLAPAALFDEAGRYLADHARYGAAFFAGWARLAKENT